MIANETGSLWFLIKPPEVRPLIILVIAKAIKAKQETLSGSLKGVFDTASY